MSCIMAIIKTFRTLLDFGGHICRKPPILIPKLPPMSFMLNKHRFAEFEELS